MCEQKRLGILLSYSDVAFINQTEVLRPIKLYFLSGRTQTLKNERQPQNMRLPTALEVFYGRLRLPSRSRVPWMSLTSLLMSRYAA